MDQVVQARIGMHRNSINRTSLQMSIIVNKTFYQHFFIASVYNKTRLIYFLWIFCLGSLIFCLLTVCTTVVIKNPPYYGSVIDIRYILFGIVKFINTPGISNLLCLFPMAFLAGLTLKPEELPRGFWVIGIIGLVLSTVAATAISQRSYFIATFVIEPLVVGIFLLLLRSWKRSLAILILLLAYPTLWWLDRLFDTLFLNRILEQSLMNDARFQMFGFWMNHLLADPLQRIEVGPVPWNIYPWFHNFFADIHRLSGFWALLTAGLLMAYIFIRLLFLIRVDQRFGLFLMAIAIPCFLIMNTSVVPEGERQPFLLLIAIGAISEVILGRHRSPSKFSDIDQGARNNVGNT